MPLPIVTADTGQKWDCQACGICCRGSIVPLSDADLERLNSQRWNERPEYQGTPLTVPHGRGQRLAHREDGSCVFLQDDGLCRIHAEFGYETKPTPCRMFPLQLAPQRNDALLTLRCACPTASKNEGRPLESYLTDVRKLVKRGELKAERIRPPFLKPGEWHDWEVVEPVLKSLSQQLSDERFPIVRRIVHGLQFVEQLEAAKIGKMTGRELRQAIADWEENAIDSSGTFFNERQRPGGAVRMLFRLAVLEHVRLLPSYFTRESWGERFRLMRAATRMAWGGGRVPTLGCELPAAKFQELEEPQGTTPIDVLSPLTRMFETTARSYLYATANRSGWSWSKVIVLWR